MCDTLCVLGDGVTLFAKNSDRPLSEPQVSTARARRAPRPAPGASAPMLRTQYIEIPDTGALATVLSQPTWLWGAEHGLNEHRVAIGNEMIFTLDDPRGRPPALIGMDLVRLGLERGRTAEETLEAMTTLLAHHGQGGIGDRVHGLSYWSSFLIADPTSAWVLETSGSTWAARPVAKGAAISNRLTLRRDWTRASSDVAAGTDVDSWRRPGLPTGFADTRLTASRAFVDAAGAPSPPDCDPRTVVGALRDHGTGPWGVPGHRSTVLPGATDAPVGSVAPAPDGAAPDGQGWTLCLHAGETAVTTASMVALLPNDQGTPARAWMALGSPCVSVYVPVPVPAAENVTASGRAPTVPLPTTVGEARVWRRFAAVRDAVGTDANLLGVVRDELSTLEDALWDEADTLGAGLEEWERFGARATTGVDDALDRLAAAGIGKAKSDR